jgi:protein required for attachment to host cells
MAAMWIVSANAGRARFFESKPSAPLEEIEDMVNDAVRLRTSEMEPDRLGPTAATSSIHNTGGALPNKTYEPHPSPHEHKTEVFAKSICKELLQAHQQGRFQQLTLVASPEFLGILRSCLDPQLKPLVTREINKDYTHVGPDQLREQIAQHQKS